MIIEVRAKNIFIFQNQVVFSLRADMRNKKFINNVHTENKYNVLKTGVIYGPNNVGKTRLIQCISVLKNIILNNKSQECFVNLFSKNPVYELGISFLSNGNEYSYDIKYDEKIKEYVYEKFSEIIVDEYGNRKEDNWLLIDKEENKCICKDVEFESMIHLVAKNNVTMYVINTEKFEHINKMKHILTAFANKIDIVDMNNIPLENTINVLKNKNELQKKVVSFIRNADLYMDNYEYVENTKIQFDSNKGGPQEKALNIPEQIMDQIRLVSTYKGVKVPSIIFDSTGTKKIAALASYVIESLEEGRILIVDELDSSIHFTLTRAIVALFNNELNDNSQLIFTTHDISLMDVKRMFRKEQIWFASKDEDGVYLYSLATFTSRNGIRDTSDIIEKYRKGVFGALPSPELFKSLLEIHKDKKANGNVQ